MGGPTDGVVAFFTHDHRECDARWAAVEEAAGGGDASVAGAAFDAFEAAMLRHLSMEEEVLFPALDAVTGGGGPTQVMRMEHEQFRGVLARMRAAFAAGDLDGLLDHGDTLLMLIQQHNRKEEGILYPMAEGLVGGRWPQLREELLRIRGGDAT